MIRTTKTLAAVVATSALLGAACTDSDPTPLVLDGVATHAADGDDGVSGNDDHGNDVATTAAPTDAVVAESSTITLLTHDSFNLSEEVLATFTDRTGIEVEILRAGDAGSVLNQAILTAGDPLGDVVFGIDNNSLFRALDAGILAPHPTPLPEDVGPQFVMDPGLNRAVPIDHGDVCLNYDRSAFGDDLPLPTTIEDLRDPQYASRLVVENPATSSPGAAFMLATIAALGEDAWLEFWADLREGGVEVTSGWEEAYYGSFSGGAGEGDRPLVVSYASSPPAEVLFGPDPDADESPIGTILGTCYQQVEFAATLTGSDHPQQAAAFVDFLLSDTVQQDIPLQMFVFPVRDVALPEVFTRFAEVADEPLELDAALVADMREAWIEQWTEVVVR